MNEVMRGYQYEFVQVCLDDIVIFSRNEYEHQDHLDKVLERLKRFGLTCNTKKYKIGLREISFLGHIVDSEGIQKQPEKLVCIDNFPVPLNVRDVRKFLGVCNWYNQFVDNYADTIAPLTNLLKQGHRWKWTKQWSFKSIKKRKSYHRNCPHPITAKRSVSKPMQARLELVRYYSNEVTDRKKDA